MYVLLFVSEAIFSMENWHAGRQQGQGSNKDSKYSVFLQVSFYSVLSASK